MTLLSVLLADIVKLVVNAREGGSCPTAVIGFLQMALWKASKQPRAGEGCKQPENEGSGQKKGFISSGRKCIGDTLTQLPSKFMAEQQKS